MATEKESIICPICGEVMSVERGLRVEECIKKGPLRFHSFYPASDDYMPVLREITDGIEKDLAGIEKEVEKNFQ